MLTTEIMMKLLIMLVKIRALELSNPNIISSSQYIKRLTKLSKAEERSTLTTTSLGRALQVAAEMNKYLYQDGTSLDDVISSISVILEQDNNIIDAFVRASKYTHDKPEEEVFRLRAIVNRTISDGELDSVLIANAFAFRNEKDPIKAKAILATIADTIEKNNAAGATASHESISESLSLDEEDKVADILDRVDSSKGLMLKFGFRGLNLMFQGGTKYGELLGVTAESHHYKSGLALTIFIHWLMYNDAPDVGEGKLATAVWYSLEDPIVNNLEFVYKLLFASYVDDPKYYNPTRAQKARYIREKLAERGWRVLFYKADPTRCNWDTPITIIDGLRIKGFITKIWGIDYIPLLPTAGLEASGGGTEIRLLVRMYTNYLAKYMIAGISPMQASPASLSLDAEGHLQTEKAAIMSKRAMFSGSKQIMQELGASVFINKIVDGGKVLLDIVLNKHKNPTAIPERLKRCILPFSSTHPIVGDLNRSGGFWHRYTDVPADIMNINVREGTTLDNSEVVKEIKATKKDDEDIKAEQDDSEIEEIF